MDNRKDIAMDTLNNYKKANYIYLGEGKSSVIYHDNTNVYKVFLLDDYEALSYKRNFLCVLQSNRNKFNDSEFFYPILDVHVDTENRFIIVYPYEKSTVCNHLEFNELQDFLVECWQKRIVFLDLKPENFIRVNGKIKWIDYEPDKFTDNLFLNMAVRGFIYSKFTNEKQSFLKKLCRSAINQFDLPELNGLHNFLNELFTKIIFAESREKFENAESVSGIDIKDFTIIEKEGYYKLPYNDNINPDKIFWQLLKKGFYTDDFISELPEIDERNYFSPKYIRFRVTELTAPDKPVSLIIKGCVQDAKILYESVKHIVRQLSSPNIFNEKILALDIKKADFLREYESENNWDQLIKVAEKLKDELLIDRVIYPHKNDIIPINHKWFGINTEFTHTQSKIPVTSQLFAFDHAKNDLVLQMDCDVMIGRLDKNHSFLNDMINELENNEKVLSVGFNIYKGKESFFTEYFGFENGGFVPEVRLGLIKKSRIEKILPLPNKLLNDGFELSWYRSLEKKQKETYTCSIRGGDSRTFYIHPQNFKKIDTDAWFSTIDRIEKLEIPDLQKMEFDLAGSYYDWTLPKRNENFVIVSCFRNIPLSRFLRYWYSLTSQTLQDWGLILIDDASDNGISHYIKELVKPYRNKITYIENRFRVGVAQNTHKAIHYYMQNSDSIVCIIDADDALIGKNSLKNIYEKYSYWDADVVVGKMYRTDKLYAHYKYSSNFINPRLYGGNVWQHIRSFKKYLYNSLDFHDLKIENKNNVSQDILISKKISNKLIFPEHCWDYSYMIPIVEMSENPMEINHYNILHDRTTINTPEIKKIKEEEIRELLNKKEKNPKDVIKGRKKFKPNLKKIEIDITYDCNLKCKACNRSCAQAPSQEKMTIWQIESFIQESIETGVKWELINILGGEPTLNPDFLEIVSKVLINYIDTYSTETILQVTSNGLNDSLTVLSRLPKHKNLVIDRMSYKSKNVVEYFTPFNDAPIDDVEFKDADYSRGCWVTSYCGIGLNLYGYYSCSLIAGIDRVIGMDRGIKSLKEINIDVFVNMLKEFCRFCGNFKHYDINRGDFIPRCEKAPFKNETITKTWNDIYEKYKISKPILTRIYENESER